ncbi:TRAP transporter substrate-binding protein [Natronospirillum operosum]|uniref:TRAP transporter substrate-binding protein n=1 Tax=Natronospirillum operosum TaxID=2759953 RepID=A0A4Z0WEB8_9GAMM|nr:TRAP transporter substrate-binding protein [Natronospirillum operosum]TGG93496.1 TRAP transporter substrate-binding protein [Natronospirillum operosum]
MKTIIRKALRGTLMTAAVAALSLSSAQANTLTMAYAQNSQPVIDALHLLADLIEEKTDGEVTVNIYPDSQLGGERELVELMQAGAVDITKVSAGLMDSFSSIYGVFSMPYLFDDTEHFYRVMDDPEIVGPVFESTADQGFVAMGYYDSGSRNFYMRNQPVQTVEDLEGKRIRVMQSETAIEMMQLLGAIPVAMGQSEVYTSIQQGILDGAENNEFAITVARHGEVAKHYSYDMHTRIPDIVLIGTSTLESLTEEQRVAVEEAMAESIEFQKEAWSEAVAEARQQSEEEFGVTFYDVDLEPFQEAVQPMYEDLRSRPAHFELYEQIISVSEQ